MSEREADGSLDSRVFGHIAHELRGLSGVTLGALSQIEVETNPERIQSLIAMARRGVLRTLHLADRLQRLGEIESGQVQWNLERRDLKELVPNAVSAASTLEPRRGISVATTLPETACLVEVDATWFSAVVTELVLAATRNARTQVSVDLTASDPITLTVSDDGSAVSSPSQGSSRDLSMLRDQWLALGNVVARAHDATFTVGEACASGNCARFQFARTK